MAKMPATKRLEPSTCPALCGMTVHSCLEAVCARAGPLIVRARCLEVAGARSMQGSSIGLPHSLSLFEEGPFLHESS